MLNKIAYIKKTSKLLEIRNGFWLLSVRLCRGCSLTLIPFGNTALGNAHILLYGGNVSVGILRSLSL